MDTRTSNRRRFYYFLLGNTFIVIGLIAFFPSLLSFSNEPTYYAPIVKESRGFLVDNMFCKITDMNPFDKSVMNIYERRGDLNCKGNLSLTYDDGVMLRMNKTAIAHFGKQSIYCHYQEFVRGSSNPEGSYVFRGNATIFHGDFRVNVDFIRVQCFNKSNKQLIYKNFHCFVAQRPSVEKRSADNLKTHKQLHRPKEMLNVLLIGVDSVSRLNSMRHMPLTRHYLLNDLNAIELKGYTKVADNTFPNIVPLTTGKHEEELPFDEEARRHYLDKFGFIWKNFTKSGYRTMFAEDDPDVQMFHYLKKGFKIAPVDHYYRVFSVALSGQQDMWENPQCFGDRTEFEIILNYTAKFALTYRDKPHFGFAFLTRLTHYDNDMNQIGAADTTYVRHYKHLDKDGLINNTVILLFSDHGMRYGDILRTYSGKLEERLPMALLVVPKWFGAKYPDHMKNLRINSERLTSPFDLYETLIDIAHFTGKIRPYRPGQRGISLFSEIPRNRTCDEAGIPQHWCACLQRKHVPTNTTSVKKSAEVIVQYINDQLAVVRKKCVILRLHKIRDALKMVGNESFLKGNGFMISFTVTVEVKPSGGVFEGTVQFHKGKKEYKVTGDISRINTYGDQSKCVNVNNLKKYCFCK